MFCILRAEANFVLGLILRGICGIMSANFVEKMHIIFCADKKDFILKWEFRATSYKLPLKRSFKENIWKRKYKAVLQLHR